MSECTDSPPRTALFRSSRGVFQGGGCRGAAHVGGYQAAIESGVRFSEVAGTSAGSIIAALVGAGASANYLNEHLLELDFRQFLLPPDRTETTHDWISAIAGRWPLRWWAEKYRLGRVILYGGAYSSEAIQSWLDARLAELLPEAEHPVRFRDLVIPTSIIATDLGAASPKIWSTRETPDEPVAFAVRASSSIPGFFQPVRMGSNRLVDGGILSNLPAFVFAGSQSGRSLGGRVLAFALQEELKAPDKWGLETLGRRLIGTVVSGATDLQTRIQPGVHVVSLPTKGVQATDFEKMTPDVARSLSDSGREATLRFIRNEGTMLQSEFRVGHHAHDLDELYTEFVREALTPGEELTVADTGTIWFWRLFPTVLAWRLSGASVHVLLTRSGEQGDQLAREEQRRTLLSRLGATVQIVDSLPFRGFLIRRADDHRNAAFVLGESETSYAPFASMYVGNSHRQIIRILAERLEELTGSAVCPAAPPSLSETPADRLIDLLKHGVWQYRPPGVSIRLETVPVTQILTINRRIRTFKFQQSEILAETFREHDLAMFGPAVVRDPTGSDISPVTPPVLERWGDKSVAVEGNTRAFFAYANNISEIEALHVYGVKEPLPGTPTELKRVLLANRHLPSEERIDGFSYAQFRSIEGAVRPLPGATVE